MGERRYGLLVWYHQLTDENVLFLKMSEAGLYLS